ncbi:MAG: ankyrin repeat domain-containing protein [Fibrobacterales bacterium]
MVITITILIVGIIVLLLIYARSSSRVRFVKAIEQCDIEGVERAIIKGIDVNVPLSNGACPVVFAALFGVPEIVQLLINAEADISSGLALHSAAMNGDTETLELLLEYGASIDGIDPEHENRSALHVAAHFNQLTAAEYLVEQGADQSMVDSQGNTWRDLLSAAE